MHSGVVRVAGQIPISAFSKQVYLAVTCVATLSGGSSGIRSQKPRRTFPPEYAAILRGAGHEAYPRANQNVSGTGALFESAPILLCAPVLGLENHGSLFSDPRVVTILS
jgi:hypothetical protein